MGIPAIIAHRGASGYAPENTLAAFKLAMELNADGIELDVHMSKDNNLIVCHDEKVDRTSNGKGYIKDMYLEEIKELDAGLWFRDAFKGEKIPTFQEVLEIVKDSGILVNIELKNGPIFYPGIEKAVVDIIAKYSMQEKVIISSFNHYSLVEVKKINSNIKTGVLYMAGLVEPWKYAKSIGAEAIHPLFYSITPEVIKQCVDNNILVNPFTVNNKEHIMLMAKGGATGIITNYPDIAKEIVNNLVEGEL